MSEVGADCLPSARIHCRKGRIRVGDRHFLSASEALAVYLQQFEKERQLHAADCSTVSNSSNSSSGMKEFSPFHSASFQPGSPVSLGAVCPGGVGHAVADSFSGKGFKPASDSASVLNGFFLPPLDSTLCLNLVEADHSARSSQQCMKQPYSVSPVKDFSAMNGILQHPTKPHGLLPHSVPLNSHQFGAGDIHEPPQQLKPTSAYTDFSSSHKLSDPLVSTVSRDLNGSGDNGYCNGVIDFLDFHVSAGSNSSNKGADLVYTAMPSQRELKRLAEDALREVKLKRLLKAVSPTSPPADPSHKKSSARCEATSSAGGERGRKEEEEEACREEKKKKTQVKAALKEVKKQELSYLLQEVDQALSRSAQLLGNLRDPQSMRNPGLARDVNHHHSPDILLSTAATPSATHDLQPSTSRSSRSRHRVPYRSHPAQARSLSQGGEPHRAESGSSAEASAPSSYNPRSPVLTGSPKFHSMENLRMSAFDDAELCPSKDSLQLSVADAQLWPSRDIPGSPSRSDSQRICMADDRVLLRSFADCDQLPSRDCLGSPVREGGQSAVHDLQPYTGVGERELRYLKKGTSVAWDCEDLLRELQAVNPPTLPGLSCHRRRSWSAQSSGQTSSSSLTPDYRHLQHTDKPQRTHENPSSDSPFSRLVSVEDLAVPRPKHTQDLSNDSFSVQGLKRASSVPCVSTLGRSVDKPLDDSSFADFSYVGPGLSYSDLVTSPAGSKHVPPANTRAELPPKPPHRRSRTSSHPARDDEPSTSAATRSRSPARSPTRSNPVLEDVADILDAIDQDSGGAETSAPEGISVYPVEHSTAFKATAQTSRVPKSCLLDHSARDDTAIAGGEGGRRGPRASVAAAGCGGQGQMLRSEDRSLPLQQGFPTTALKDCTAGRGNTGAAESAVTKSEYYAEEEKEKDEAAAELLPALKGYRYDLEPGRQSLEKALVHLGRLKSLVQTSPSPVASHVSTTTTTVTSGDPAPEPSPSPSLSLSSSSPSSSSLQQQRS